MESVWSQSQKRTRTAGPAVDPTRKDTAREWATIATNVADQAISRPSAGQKSREEAEDKDEVAKADTKEEVEGTTGAEPQGEPKERRKRKKESSFG